MKTAATARRWAMCAGLVAVVALWPKSAFAEATLEARVVGATCTVTTSEGATTVLPCSPDSWVVALQPNWSAQMVATIEYVYADDGLPLARPQGITLGDAGSVRTVFFEAGALYVKTSFCAHFGFVCQTGRSWESYNGTPDFYPPVFISDNEIADSFSGTLTVTTGAFFAPAPPTLPSYTWNPNIYVALNSVSALTFSGIEPVGAIPEPGTSVLMLLGLGALASTALRHSRCSLSR